MISDLYIEPNDATPLAPEERDGLIPSHIALRRELNELEQQNILSASTWAFTRRHNAVSEPFGRMLHKRMFAKVWRWAGQYRTTDKNIGVPAYEVPVRLQEVYGSAHYWIEHNSFSADEIAVRFHHSLVFIHPFPNGNGRWSRLMADVLVAALGQPRFTWGRSTLRTADQTRADYIAALKEADCHEFTALIAFARS
jgi:Fic-DOC domain mobile mystery protein B